MRKIDKIQILSETYKAWVDSLEASAANHPKYDSSHHFYWDIVMNLYHCQQGLCAYTETKLMPNSNYYRAENWQKGQYSLINKPEHLGDLEHFDSTLKPNKAWLWDNLFMVLGRVNVLKGIKSVNKILKPDLPDYDPFFLLEYDATKNVFFPNTTNLTEDEQDEVKKMILTLGINFVKDWRKDYLREKIKAITFGIETWETIEIDEYPTAFEMCRQQILSNNS